ncbi:5-formyltetrahydrofolate cyclo-ligase [Roseinatronobacter alkalisoli]|uniref:5-formyltetrahydrofolate cyclo-ligase n=1 Tax=Roseinatronobacter alkalisoli TaxID=3028235 RepID=A0ABT5T810_9RHOB|nr:5-formyltetrahydrofolate cyclo-ligase [Roseinatronobacter sp. HJB301]MDD7971257.1 5-formyltetrahydrofolate cyclo-ligase [Roseinatronobacter sp. HJB301]
MQHDTTTRKAQARNLAAIRRNAAFLDIQAAQQVAAASRSFSDYLADIFGDRLADVTLAGYMPMRSEISPLDIMANHPGPVGVPVILRAGTPLEFHRWTPQTTMIEGAFKALIPANADPVIPQALIVPMLAFDRRGYRLGYGGGFYDRTLEKLRSAGPVLAVGLAFDAQICDDLPTEATDQQLDAIITGSGVIWTRG